MKRFLALLLAVIMALSLIACDKEDESSSKKVYDDTLPEDGYTLDDILENLYDAGFEEDDIVVKDKEDCEKLAEFADVRDACDGRILFYIEAEDPSGGFVFIYGMQKLEDLSKVRSIVAGTDMEEEILNKSFKNVIAIGTKMRTIKATFGDDAVALDGGYIGDMIADNLTIAGFEDISIYDKNDIAERSIFEDVRAEYEGEILFCVEAISKDDDYIFVFGAPNSTNLEQLKSAGALFGPANISYIYSNVVVFAQNMDDAYSAIGLTELE